MTANSAQEAEERVAAYLDGHRPGLAVLRGKTLERAGVWLVFANAAVYAQTGDMRDMLLGLGPILVDRATDDMYWAGSAETVDFWVERYRSGELTGLEPLRKE